MKNLENPEIVKNLGSYLWKQIRKYVKPLDILGKTGEIQKTKIFEKLCEKLEMILKEEF